MNDKKSKRTEVFYHLIQIDEIMVEIIIPEFVEWIIGIVIGKKDRITFLKSPTVAGTFFSYLPIGRSNI
ncbi:MAG: hypothetical protein KAW92_07120 [Candidatus Cloacimonetes bacterium]|nr:hypothetical protein [Candidatus Cloacimonadota bacterium]